MGKLKRALGIFISLIVGASGAEAGFIKMETFNISTVMYSKSAGEALIGGVDTNHSVGAFVTCKVKGIAPTSIKVSDLTDCTVLQGSMYDARDTQIVEAINQTFPKTFERIYLEKEQVLAKGGAAIRQIAKFGTIGFGAALTAAGILGFVTTLQSSLPPNLRAAAGAVVGLIIAVFGTGIDTSVAEIPALESSLVNDLGTAITDGAVEQAETLFTENDALEFYGLFKRAIVTTISEVTGV